MNEDKTTLDVSGETAPSGNVLKWDSLALTGKLHINLKPSYTITMHRPDREVAGKLDFNGPKLIFTGDAEESAKVFMNYLTMVWDKRLQEEREAEREACAKVCEEVRDVFASPRYATGQPLSSIRERFAAGQCVEAIRARSSE